jgi:hypothetical protein
VPFPLASYRASAWEIKIAEHFYLPLRDIRTNNQVLRPNQYAHALVTPAYRSTHGHCRNGGPVQNLSHSFCRQTSDETEHLWSRLSLQLLANMLKVGTFFDT